MGEGVRVGVDEGMFVGVMEGKGQISNCPDTFDCAVPPVEAQDSAFTVKLTLCDPPEVRSAPERSSSNSSVI